jgi:small subunit ribosomal protein S9
MTSVIQYYGTGRRKSATARVRLVPGTGQISVNGRPLNDYVGGRAGFDKKVMVPFQAADAQGRFDVIVSVRGGGIAGQVDAVRHGISRALAEAAPQNRPVLRTGGFLTRDSRVKERKKYGRKRARKRFQFSKR